MPDLTFRLSDEDVQRIATAVAEIIQQPQKQMLTPQEVAERLGVSVQTVRRRITAGEFGQTVNDGKMHRVTAVGLRQYIDRHTGQAYSPAQAKQRQRRTHVSPGRI